MAVAILGAGGAGAQDARSVIDKASRAIGVDSVKTLEYSGSGSEFAFGQAPNAVSPWPRFIVKSYSRVIDFEKPATRIERVRLQGENPPRGGGGQPLVGEQKQTQSIVVDSGTSWQQQLDIWGTPYGFLRAAAAHDSQLETRVVGGTKYRVVTFSGPGGAKVSGYIDAHDLVERIDAWVDTPVLGDTPLDFVYSDYKDFDGKLFPAHIVQIEGAHPVLDIEVKDVKVNVPVNVQSVPAIGATQGTQSEKLGDGVYLITGGYAVIAVDFTDHITLFESGQSETRALAVIAEAQRLIPGKPVRYVVNTHSHFDHAGGLRAFVAEGATILTYQSNQAYLRNVLARPHTINPDKAQGSSKKPVVEAVGEKKVLTDGTHTVELYHLRNFGHHDGMLIAYFPREKVLFEADAYNPLPAGSPAPSPANPFNVSLLDNIRRLKLDVARIIPVHYPADYRVVTLTELNNWAGRGGS
jgi:glyoxylase-like metal-dependent hydrolase (beta-lactamase superfamily II)